MASTTTQFARSILIVHLASLRDGHRFTEAIKTATERTSERLLIILFCDALNEDKHLNHVAAWNDVQGLLTFVYVEATRVAQDADRILMDVNVLLRGLDKDVAIDQEEGWQHVFKLNDDLRDYPLPSWVSALPATSLPVVAPVTDTSNAYEHLGGGHLKPPTYPVIALGGTFDHLHSGHKILLSMSAWIAHEKVIIGVTDDKLLQKKVNRHVLESLDVRIEHVRRFLEFFKPGLIYDAVPLDDVCGPTAVDPNIQALVVSKETLSGASIIAEHREKHNLPPLDCFVIDVISMTEANLEFENLDLLRSAKLSSTYIREWIVRKRAEKAQEEEL